jgi:tryptophan 2,3-dioxygenase
MTDLHRPILPGAAGSDYERYLRTDELLSLQKPQGEQLHRDELLFQTIHQASELWLKLACFEIDDAIRGIDGDEGPWAVRLLRRACAALDLVSANTLMLEHLNPWDYHQVRQALGHGSGFDSPGFRATHEVSPRLGEAFSRLLTRREVDLPSLYQNSRMHDDVYQVAERLVDWDQRLIMWRTLHLKLVERVIGGHVIGTQGTPVEVLSRRTDVRYFPDLWDVRNALTDARVAGLDQNPTR